MSNEVKNNFIAGEEKDATVVEEVIVDDTGGREGSASYSLKRSSTGLRYTTRREWCYSNMSVAYGSTSCIYCVNLRQKSNKRGGSGV